ncbi:MAG: M23 family metallopeptidase [Clostridia bacterium]|nr:M23 family metallopeptidase [Clostridia bacterium]
MEKESLLLYGASSFHKGIDIGAPEGTKLYAICDGEITFADFLGGGGYTITLSKENMKITYCHVSPDFLVSVRRCCAKRSTYC